MTCGRQWQLVLWCVAWIAAAVFSILGLGYAWQVGLGYDSHAYWAAVQHMDDLYSAPALVRDAYLYSPAFAQVIWPLGRLPWPVFGILWSGLALAAFIWLLRPIPARWFAPAIVAVLPEVATGNVYAFMAVTIILGVRHGWPWTFLGLTKIVPASAGFLWLLLRRDWRALVHGSATTVLVTGLSWLLSPQLWRDWLAFLSGPVAPDSGHGYISSPLLTLILLTTGIAFVVWGAVRKRAWPLAVSAILLSPTIGVNTFTLLAAVPRLRRMKVDTHAGPDTHTEAVQPWPDLPTDRQHTA